MARQKLMTKTLAKAIPPYDWQKHEPGNDLMVVGHYFTPWSNWDWYIIDGDPLATRTPTNDNPDVFSPVPYDPKDHDTYLDWWLFGLVDGDYVELGTFSLRELENLRGPYGLRVERDAHWRPKPLSEVREACTGIQ